MKVKPLDLPLFDFAILEAMLLISMTFIVCSTIYSLFLKKRGKELVISAILFAVIALNLSCFLEMYVVKFSDEGRELSSMSGIVGEIPVYCHYLLVIAVIVFSSLNMYLLYNRRKRTFSNYSIKEIVETSNSGLIYYDIKGNISLSNHMMHMISIDLTGKALQNGIEFESDLKKLQNSGMCLVSGQEPIFKGENKAIWRFTKTKIQIEKEDYLVIKADDITETYRLTEEIKSANEKLKIEHKRLEGYLSNIDKLISGEENLRIKMMIHDEFGELIVLTARAYENGASQNVIDEIIEKWGNLSDKMKDKASFVTSKEFGLERVIKLGEMLKCQVEIIGELPENTEQYEVVVNGIYESLKNAVYHAKANKLLVTSECESDDIVVLISNETKNNLKNIVEGGGLRNLRRKVENSGGTMDITCLDSVTLKLRFPNG